eukprot:1832118-Karenia_brevis.AAC.1
MPMVRVNGPDGTKRANPWNGIVQNGGCVDVWYLDDGTGLMRPELVASYLKAYDAETQKRGGRRN